MVTENFAKQIIDFQKATFDNAFDAVVMLQDHAERMTQTVMKQANWLPEEGKQVMDQWVGMAKKGRDDFKELVDQNFDNLADYFVDPATLFTLPKTQKPKTVKPK
jgi:hypothetical protein